MPSLLQSPTQASAEPGGGARQATTTAPAVQPQPRCRRSDRTARCALVPAARALIIPVDGFWLLAPRYPIHATTRKAAGASRRGRSAGLLVPTRLWSRLRFLLRCINE